MATLLSKFCLKDQTEDCPPGFAVQVKSRASEREYLDYRSKYADMRGYTRFYFVTHSPTAKLDSVAREADDKSFVFWGPQERALYAARNGLVGWLLDKAS